MTVPLMAPPPEPVFPVDPVKVELPAIVSVPDESRS